MKNIIKITIVALALFSFCSVTAQNVKSQSKIMKTLKKGRYKIIATGLRRYGDMEITNIVPDKNQPKEHVEISLARFPDKKGSDRRESDYFRDNLAFPVTYVKNNYAGMKKIQRRVGYVLDKGRDVGRDRIAVVDNYIFIISEWKDKDNYWIYEILGKTSSGKSKVKKKKKKKSFGAFYKALKTGVKTASSGGGGGKTKIAKLRKEILQPYLDKGFAKQKTVYASWIKKSKNAALKNRLDGLYKKVKKADRDYVKHYNDSLSATPKYKKIDAHIARMRNMKDNKVTIINNTGRNLLIYVDGSGSSDRIHKGNSEKYDCERDIFYKFDNGGNVNTLTDINNKIYSAKSKCNGTITIK